MVRNPHDRADAVRPMIERAGGKLHGLWFAFGDSDSDIDAIAEMPNNTSAAAISMAIGASGAMSSYRSTPLDAAHDLGRSGRGDAACCGRVLPGAESAKPRPTCTTRRHATPPAGLFLPPSAAH